MSSTESAADGGRPAPKPEHRLPPLTPADAPVAHEHEDPVPRASRPAPADVPWFLPAGRAGLAPESLDEEADTDPKPVRALPETAANIVSSPPWASDPPTADLGIPPWESGPWPSRRPGGAAADGNDSPAAVPAAANGAADARAGAGQNGSAPRASQNGTPPGAAARGSGGPGAGSGAAAMAASRALAGRPGGPGAADGDVANPFAMPALVAGIAGFLVLPGLILGALGVRKGRATGAGLLRSWLGIGLSVLWAVAIIFVAMPGSSSNAADPGCTAYKATAQPAVQQVSSGLSSGAPAAQLRPGLRQAATKVNGAAAQAQAVAVRSALAGLTEDLQSSLSEVTAGRPVPRSLMKGLTSDISAAARACG